MTRTVSLYQAKTQLSALVDAAASGEEIVIAKNGVAKARLVPIRQPSFRANPSGLLNITYIAEDFDAPDPEFEALFEGKSCRRSCRPIIRYGLRDSSSRLDKRGLLETRSNREADKAKIN